MAPSPPPSRHLAGGCLKDPPPPPPPLPRCFQVEERRGKEREEKEEEEEAASEEDGGFLQPTPTSHILFSKLPTAEEDARLTTLNESETGRSIFLPPFFSVVDFSPSSPASLLPLPSFFYFLFSLFLSLLLPRGRFASRCPEKMSLSSSRPSVGFANWSHKVFLQLD